MAQTFDKSQTIKLADDIGVPTPETYVAKNMKDLKAISKKVTFPVVIKPRRSWVWKGDKPQYSRACYAKSEGELVSAYETLHSVFPFPLIQEYIPGTSQNYSIGALYSNSHPRAMCCIKVHRTFPISGGNSVLRESVEMDHRMKTYAARLLEALDWHGVAEVEFKLDPRDNVPKFMEINGRFWGSLEVAIQAGVDFPYLLYRLMVDGDVPEVSNYKVGIKCRWIEGDLHHIYNVFKRKFGIQFPNRSRTFFDFLKVYEKNLKYDSFDWKDPYPFLELIREIKGRWKYLC
jgi:predicted ATP-grasp superfamily ATP-dependent carboligase